jgi:hypothetical protein
MNGPVTIRSTDFWVKVVGMLQQNWTLIEDEAAGAVRVYSSMIRVVCSTRSLCPLRVLLMKRLRRMALGALQRAEIFNPFFIRQPRPSADPRIPMGRSILRGASGDREVTFRYLHSARECAARTAANLARPRYPIGKNEPTTCPGEHAIALQTRTKTARRGNDWAHGKAVPSVLGAPLLSPGMGQ